MATTIKKINYKSDFELRYSLVDLEDNPASIPSNPWELWLSVGNPLGTNCRKFVAKYDGTNYTNCSIDNDQIVVYADNHKLPTGRLWVTFINYQPNADYPDGNKTIYTPQAADIELVTGAGDLATAAEIEATANYVLYDAYQIAVMEGYTGTQEQYYDALISLPSICDEAFAATETATRAAADATVAVSDAQSAVISANAAVSNANTAIAACQAATQNANEQAAEALSSAEIAKQSADDADKAAVGATNATTAANNATTAANTAAEGANQAMLDANDAALDANTAATAATTAASGANRAISDCNTAAEGATQATVACNMMMEELADAAATCNAATRNANTAATNADNAASSATSAATSASNAADAAYNAADSATEVIGDCNTAASAATSAAESATAAATNVGTAITNANNAASSASSAATSATNAASAANSAAQSASSVATTIQRQYDETMIVMNNQINELIDGKAMIASALTDRGYPTQPTDSSASMAQKIENMAYDAGWLAQLGYSEQNDGGVKDAVAYSKAIKDGWNPSETTRKFTNDKKLVFFPSVDTSQYTTFLDMFKNSGVGFIPSLNTDRVTNMSNAFYECRGLHFVANINTSMVTNMSQMFSYCSSLSKLPTMDTSAVTTMQDFCWYCESLTEFPQLDTSNVTDMRSLISNCIKVVTLPALDSHKVTTMQYLCFNDVNLNYIEGLDISACSNFDRAFSGATNICYALFKGFGTLQSKTTYNDTNSFNMLSIWGTGSETNRQSLVDSLLTYSFDRATAGYSYCTIKLHADTLARLTAEEIAAITAKGFTLTS